jgi:hypothetical protein
MRVSRKFLSRVALVAGILAISPGANAALITVQVMRGTTVHTWTDQQFGPPIVDEDGTLNSFDISESVLITAFPELSTGSNLTVFSNQNSGDPFATLTIQSNFKRANTGAVSLTYTILAYQTDFFLPVGPGRLVTSSHSATFTQANGSTAQYAGWANAANAAPPAIDADPSMPIVGISPGLHGAWQATSNFPQSFSNNLGPVPFSDSDSYSLIGRLSFTLNRRGQLSTSGTVSVNESNVVPEPATLGMFGLGLVGIVMLARRKK